MLRSVWLISCPPRNPLTVGLTLMFFTVKFVDARLAIPMVLANGLMTDKRNAEFIRRKFVRADEIRPQIFVGGRQSPPDCFLEGFNTFLQPLWAKGS
ncbi:MAG: hypothetical protein NZ937_00150 [Armatimonadetes bacterium]|nr:hypothetical protein [Armatimonadota bacterium]